MEILDDDGTPGPRRPVRRDPHPQRADDALLPRRPPRARPSASRTAGSTQGRRPPPARRSGSSWRAVSTTA
jgi:hypothetical protein